MQALKLKINVTKILKEHLYAGEKGKYLNVVVWPRRDGPDKFGNTYSITQDLPKEVQDARKAAGEGSHYIGDGKELHQQGNAAAPAAKPADPRKQFDDVPF